MDRTMIIIIKKIANDFEGEFNCLEENTEKYKTFLVTTKKEIKRNLKNRK